MEASDDRNQPAASPTADWPTLAAKLIDDLSRMMHAEIRLAELGLKNIIQSIPPSIMDYMLTKPEGIFVVQLAWAMGHFWSRLPRGCRSGAFGDLKSLIARKQASSPMEKSPLSREACAISLRSCRAAA